MARGSWGCEDCQEILENTIKLQTKCKRCLRCPKRDPTIKPQPPKMIKIVRNCDLRLEKLEAFGFLFHICTCSLPGKISRRRTPQNLDHFGLLPGRPGSHHVPPIASEVSQKLVSQATAAGWPGAQILSLFPLKGRSYEALVRWPVYPLLDSSLCAWCATQWQLKSYPKKGQTAIWAPTPNFTFTVFHCAE